MIHREVRKPVDPVAIDPTLARRIAPSRGAKILLIDLNNFANFPTLAIGLLVASLRDAGHQVEVLCPLAYDRPGAAREARETIRDHFARRIHLSTWPPFRATRDLARRSREWWITRPDPGVLRETRRALAGGPDILLLSAYLRHYPTVSRIGRLAAEAGIPMLLGGPMMNLREVGESWRELPGLSAIFGGEADLVAPRLVETTLAGGDLLAIDGVLLPDGRRSPPAAPLRDLDRTPVADFTDFPWDRYPNRIVPIMTGRGCQWGRCAFCGDVVSANGRTFRTRSLDSVLTEMREQSLRHATNKYLFLDLKLNSNPNMFRGIAENVQRVAPGAEWIGTIHVDHRRDNGLSRRDLKAAAASGMRRISFGLETGSQRLLDAMDKGNSVEANAAFIRDAYDAGLSVRCTMFKGFPGETARDLEETAVFLERHAPYLDRVRFNEFALVDETPIFNELRARSSARPQIALRTIERRYARARGETPESGSRAYRRAKARALRAVYAINRRELRPGARAFDGPM